MRVAQQAVLDGTLDLGCAGTYAPGLTTTLGVLAMASRLGKFNQLRDTTLPYTREWHAVYGNQEVRLRADLGKPTRPAASRPRG